MGEARRFVQRQGVAAWTVNLDLVTTTSRRRGSMCICRFYTQRDLQLDVNLLTSVSRWLWQMRWIEFWWAPRRSFQVPMKTKGLLQLEFR